MRSGLSEEPGRRYSGGDPSRLEVSAFVLLKERLRLFAFGKPESAAVTMENFNTSLLSEYAAFHNAFVFMHSLCVYQVCVHV